MKTKEFLETCKIALKASIFNKKFCKNNFGQNLLHKELSSSKSKGWKIYLLKLIEGAIISIFFIKTNLKLSKF